MRAGQRDAAGAEEATAAPVTVGHRPHDRPRSPAAYSTIAGLNTPSPLSPSYALDQFRPSLEAAAAK
ncbi:hypothetical protein [Saccharopolyspora sp. NPDC049357]|uniref:hypothetical protein n=1 Tax=Saccharopolyspora sp. NPDC049357 TaxID=3154507 RepID=UPI003425D047